jgi:putative PIN family toxin of toxin-antitoxin system
VKRLPKIKVVIDTNVLISSLWGGKPQRIIEIWDKNEIFVLVSQQILDEYFNVLNRFDLTEEDVEDITILFANPNKTIFVEPDVKLNVIKTDIDDNKFLECAKSGNADYIISGDGHLLGLGTFEDIKIVTAKKFLDII